MNRCWNCGNESKRARTYCAACLERRRPKDQARRHSISSAVFTAERRDRLLRLLAARVPFAEACEDVGVSVNHVYGYRRIDAGWAEALDAALMEGRDPELDHGTHTAHRWGGCRCPECRAVKAAARPPSGLPVPSPWATEVSQQQREIVLAMLRMGAPKADAAAHAGLTPGTLRRLRTQDEAFQADYLAARRLAGRPKLLPHRDELDRMVRLLRAEGASNEAIGEVLGGSAWAVSRRAVELGLSSGLPAWKGVAQPPVPREELPERLRELWPDQTLSVAEIAKQLGVSKETVRRRGIKMGLPSRRTVRPN